MKITKRRLQQIINEELAEKYTRGYHDRDAWTSGLTEQGCADDTDGCVREDDDGTWYILNNKKGGVWRKGFKSKKSAKDSLEAMHSQKESMTAEKCITEVCRLLRENRNNPNALIAKRYLADAALHVEMTRYLKYGLYEQLDIAQPSPTSGPPLPPPVSNGAGQNVDVSDEMVEEAEEADVEEKTVRYHLWTLIQAGFAPAAAGRMVLSLLKGDIKGAIMNAPLLNLWFTPEAFWGLLDAALGSLPQSVREDIVGNNTVKYLMKLLFSVKEVTTSADVNAFYNNIKQAISASKPAFVALAKILLGFFAACAGIAAGALSLAIAIEGLSAGVCTPLCASVFAVAVFVESICVGGIAATGAGAGVLAGLAHLVDDIDLNDESTIDEKFNQQMWTLLDNMESQHKKKVEEAEAGKEDSAQVAASAEAEAAVASVEPEAFTAQEPIPPSAQWSDQAQPALAESFSRNRMLILSGISPEKNR